MGDVPRKDDTSDATFRRELEWVAGWWFGLVVVGMWSITWRSGGRDHNVAPLGLLVTPFLLVGLRWLATSATGEAARRLRRTSTVAVVTAVASHGGAFLTGRPWMGSWLVLFGLLSFTDAMAAWASDRSDGALTRVWERARRWTLLSLVATALVAAAWVGRGLVTGEWGEWTSSSTAMAVPVLGGVVLFLGTLLSTARATHRTLLQLDAASAPGSPATA